MKNNLLAIKLPSPPHGLQGLCRGVQHHLHAPDEEFHNSGQETGDCIEGAVEDGEDEFDK